MHPPPEAKKEPKGYGITRVFNPPKTPQKGGWAPPGGGPGPPKGGVQGGGYTPPQTGGRHPPWPPGGWDPPPGGGSLGVKKPPFWGQKPPFLGGSRPPSSCTTKGVPLVVHDFGVFPAKFPVKNRGSDTVRQEFLALFGGFLPRRGVLGPKMTPQGGSDPPPRGGPGAKKGPPKGVKTPPQEGLGGGGPPPGGGPGAKRGHFKGLDGKVLAKSVFSGKKCRSSKISRFSRNGAKTPFLKNFKYNFESN